MSWLKIIGLLLLVAALVLLEVFVIYWAVNLFTEISYLQAFGIMVILAIIKGTLRGNK